MFFCHSVFSEFSCCSVSALTSAQPPSVTLSLCCQIVQAILIPQQRDGGQAKLGRQKTPKNLHEGRKKVLLHSFHKSLMLFFWCQAQILTLPCLCLWLTLALGCCITYCHFNTTWFFYWHLQWGNCPHKSHYKVAWVGTQQISLGLQTPELFWSGSSSPHFRGYPQFPCTSLWHKGPWVRVIFPCCPASIFWEWTLSFFRQWAHTPHKHHLMLKPAEFSNTHESSVALPDSSLLLMTLVCLSSHSRSPLSPQPGLCQTCSPWPPSFLSRLPFIWKVASPLKLLLILLLSPPCLSDRP